MSVEPTARDVEALAHIIKASGFGPPWLPHARIMARIILTSDWYANRPMTCPTCGGAGIVDTSPPGVEHTAPWLQTDTDCPACTEEKP